MDKCQRRDMEKSSRGFFFPPTVYIVVVKFHCRRPNCARRGGVNKKVESAPIFFHVPFEKSNVCSMMDMGWAAALCVIIFLMDIVF